MVYLVNKANETEHHLKNKMMPLVHFILESHNISKVKGTFFLQCSHNTTEEEIISFCYRSIYSRTTKVSFILNPENLDEIAFNNLRKTYETIIGSIKEMRSVNVVMIFGEEKKDYIESIKSSLFFMRYARKLDYNIKNNDAKATF